MIKYGDSNRSDTGDEKRHNKALTLKDKLDVTKECDCDAWMVDITNITRIFVLT
jgi:hypothetical protein